MPPIGVLGEDMPGGPFRKPVRRRRDIDVARYVQYPLSLRKGMP